VPAPRTALLTALALIGFAANSLLCRLALAAGEIDAGGFTAVRLATGALALAVLRRWRDGPACCRPAEARAGGDAWIGPALLVGYAAPFAFAYVRIGAGVGALALFAAVQLTMLGSAVARGERPAPRTWAGLVLALGGLAGLALPGAAAPDPLGLALMVVAGVAWGAYSLRGRGAVDPLATTAASFARGAPLALAVALAAAALAAPHATARGLALAAASGALASGVGYALWYAALPALGATRAAVVQLLVPVVAAGAAIPLLGESPTARLGLASVAILGGVALALVPIGVRSPR
jgi:drug/metabolite transporter (DMT)-like permease